MTDALFFPFTYKFSNEYFSSSILHPGGASRVSQVDGGSDVAQAWQLFAERDHQRNNGLCQHFCLGGSHLPPTLTLMPDNSVPPRVSLAPFKWLELRRVSWREPMRSPLKGTAWDSRSPLSPSSSIPAGFYSQKLWGLLFLALGPWAGGPAMGPPGSSGETSEAQISLLTFILHMWVWGPGRSTSPPLLPVSLRFHLPLFGGRTSIQLDSRPFRTMAVL